MTLSTGTAGDDVSNAPVTGGGGTISLKGSKISEAIIDPGATLSQLGSGENSSNHLYCDEKNFGVLQVALHPYQAGWDFMSQVGNVKVSDTNGNTFPANGFYVVVRSADSSSVLFRYSATQNITGGIQPTGTVDGDIYFVFLIPHGTEIKSFSMGGKTQDLPSSQTIP